MRRQSRWRRGWGQVVALAIVVAASGAQAVGLGGKLYVRARNTRLLKQPSPTADVVATLQPPQEVVWEGPDPRNKQWHRVKVGGRTGYVFQSNLAARPPDMELKVSKGSRVDARAFASSGAAVKAVSSGVLALGQQRVELKQAITQLDTLEALARQVTEEDVAAHARQAGLKPAVLTGSRAVPSSTKEGSK